LGSRAQLYSDGGSRLCQVKIALRVQRAWSTVLTAGPCRVRIMRMKERLSGPETEPARDEWVRVYPDRPAYQKLHLCQYLVELPEPGTEALGDEQTPSSFTVE
jgi:hypothetical protein